MTIIIVLLGLILCAILFKNAFQVILAGLALGIVIVALIAIAMSVAHAESCMPHAPNGHAPKWAVNIEERRGDNIATSASDPIWQHANCDKRHHTVTWNLPGEEFSCPAQFVTLPSGREIWFTGKSTKDGVDGPKTYLFKGDELKEGPDHDAAFQALAKVCPNIFEE